MDIAAAKIDAEKANTYEERYRNIYEGYRRSYPHIIKDFVSMEDFNEFLSQLKRLFRDLYSDGFQTEASRSTRISALSIGSAKASAKIIKRGSSDFDGSRVDMDMRVNSISKISTRFF